MAILELCDLCGGKSMKSLSKMIMQGSVQAWYGEIPPAPKGFVYKEDYSGETTNTIFIKKWDSFGKVITEINLVEKPKRYKNISVTYDLCELCTQKMIGMLETLRQHYHLESKEIELLEDKNRRNPLDDILGIGFDD